MEFPEDAADTFWVLKFPPGLHCLEIDGRLIEVNDRYGYVTLPRELAQEGQRKIVLRTGKPAVELSVYRAFAEGEWEVYGLAGRELPHWQPEAKVPTRLPFHLAPGSIGLFNLRWPEFPWTEAEAVHLVVDGRDCKLTVCLGMEVVGRLWLPSSGRPPFAGGVLDGWLFVPRGWLAANPEMRLIIEAVGDRPGLVNSLHLDAIIPSTVVKVTLPSGY
ncbi:MAG: hypothetical protein GX493_02170 [Firmicutes bacterium]|nr:hypothetical protein [Bacillota bacterium]